MKRPRVILADDHQLLLDAFKNLLQAEFDVVGTFADGSALVEGSARLAPDVIVLDIAMPGMDGLRAGQLLKQQIPKVKIVYLTMNLDPEIAAEALRLGASAYVVKNSAATELLDAINRVLHGGSYISTLVVSGTLGSLNRGDEPKRSANALSVRQKEVLRLLAEGRSMKEVAYLLNVTARTVAFHKYTMMENLQLRSSAELIGYAFRNSLAGNA
jgi:DNA-binding NarL/FixJ family response regulator